MPTWREAADETNPHGLSKEEDAARLLVKGMLEGWRPKRVAREEGHDPLCLQRWNCHHGREEADPAVEAGTTTNCHRWCQCGVSIPDRIPAKMSEFEEEWARGR